MTLPGVVAAAMFVGVIIYAVFGGADFGSAFYDLTAGSGKPGAELRTFVDHSVGPVWEVNRVWLVYVLVMWWSGFPAAFAAAVTTLFIPLMLALIGIMLRGASFAFRRHATTFTSARLFGAVFAGSSLITPFFFGTVVGGIASGRVPAGGYGDQVGSWINPTSLVCGGLAVTTCIFLAGVFLTADAAHTGNTPLIERLRKRTLAVGVLSGTIALAGVHTILHDAPTLSHGLLHTAFPPLVAADIAGAFALILLYHRSYALAALFRRRRRRRLCHRVGSGPVPVDPRRPPQHRRRRGSPNDTHRTARRRRARRRPGATRADLPVQAVPVRTHSASAHLMPEMSHHLTNAAIACSVLAMSICSPVMMSAYTKDSTIRTIRYARSCSGNGGSR